MVMMMIILSLNQVFSAQTKEFDNNNNNNNVPK